jgi:hypothetical protein
VVSDTGHCHRKSSLRQALADIGTVFLDCDAEGEIGMKQCLG